MEIPSAVSGQRTWLLGRLMLNGFAQALATVAHAQLVKLAFDKLIRHSDLASKTMMMWIGIGLGATASVMALLRVLERTDAECIGQNYATEVRITLYERLSSLAPRALQLRSQGGVMLRFVGDLTSVRQWVSLGLARLAVTVTTTAITLVALALINLTLAFTVALILVIGILAMFKLGQQIQTKARESRRRLSYLAANINEKIAAMSVVQVFGQNRREKKRIVRQSRKLEKARISWARVAGKLRGVGEATAMVATGATLLIGAFEVAKGRATAGTVVAAMTIISLLVPSLRDLSRVQEYWHNYEVARQKMAEFLKTPTLVTEIPNAPHLKAKSGRLEFQSVTVSGVLQEVSVIAQPGQIVAIVGSNGAGKSTLLSLAARLLDPDAGKIYLDGQDLAVHSLASVRRAIGMASPDLPLLRGTIAKNLLYRHPDASQVEIDRVWHLCGIPDLLTELPKGDQTRISERGVGLSAGQRQRIALARAIVGKPPLLLLDEVDANLDVQAAAIVERVLQEHQGTILIVTHRRERLAFADVIWYLEEGQLRTSQ
jgi:ABC-type multidrug transport system fused ATPase/permease subunit